jgi:phage-related protein
VPSVFSAGSASVNVVPDFSNAQKTIGEWFAGQKDLHVKVSPDLDQTKLAAIKGEVAASRSDMKVGMDSSEFHKKLLGITDQLTGLSATGGVIEKLFGPKSILMVSGVGAFTAIAAAVSQAAGAALLLPAAVSGLVAPVAAVAIGMHGVSDAFKALATGDVAKTQAALDKLAPAARSFVEQIHALGPAWTALRLDVQQQLFEGLGRTISDLAHAQLPTLRAGLSEVAGQLNVMVTGIARVLASRQSVADFAAIFHNVSDATGLASTGMAAITQSLVSLSAVGSQFLPRLAEAFSNVAVMAQRWVDRARESGQLTAIINQAIAVLDQLGRILLNVGQIIGNVFGAGVSSGNILLSVIEQLTGNLATFLRTPVAQSALKTFFEEITSAITILMPAVNQLIQVFVTNLLPAIGGVVSALAPLATTVLGEFADLLRQIAPLIYPAIANALAAWLSATAPLIPLLSQMATTILPVLTKILTDLAPYMSQLTETVGKALLTAVQAVVPLLPPLADAFQKILNAVLPLLAPLLKIATDALPPLVQLVEALLPLVVSIVQAFVALVKPLIPLADSLIPAFVAGFQFLLPIIEPLAGLILAVVVALKAWAIIQAVINLLLDANPIGIIILAIGALILIIGEIITHLQFFKDLWNTVWGAVKDFFITVWTAIRDFAVSVWDGIKNVASTVWGAIRDFFVTVFTAIRDFFVTIWTSVRDFFVGIWNGIVSFIQGVLNGIRDFFVAIWTAVSNYLHEVWQENKDWITAVWNFIKDIAVTVFTAVRDFFVTIFTAIRDFIVTIWNAIYAFFQTIFTAIRDFAVTIWNAIFSFFQTVLGAIRDFFVTIWNGIYSFFQTVLGAIRDFFVTIWNGVYSFFSGVLTNIRDFFVSIWNGIHDTAVSIWNAISSFFQSAFDTFKNAFVTVWNAISNAFKAVWQGMKDAVASIWEGIKAVFAAPINFVIRYILNDGLFKAWNWIVDHLALPGHGQSETGPNSGWKLHLDEIPGFRKGGYTGNRPRNAPAGVVHGGEYVFTADQTETAGVDTLSEYAAALDGRSGGFYKGGYVPKRLAAFLPGYQAGGPVGGMTWPTLWDIVHKHDSAAVKTSDYRPGANDLHGLGDAIDISYPGNPHSRNDPLAAWIAGAYPGSSEIIHNPNASVKNGRPVPPSFWGAATWAAHANHVHWGVLPAAMAGIGVGGTGADPAGQSIVGFFGEVWHSIADVLSDLNNAIVKPLGNLYSQFGSTGVGGLIGGVPAGVLKMIWDGLSGEIAKYFAAISSDDSNTPGDVAGLKSQAYATANAMYGWNTPADTAAIDYIVSHESSWNPKAQNPTSSASGLWQEIDSTWNSTKPIEASSYAHAKDAPAGMQDKAGIRYVHDRYKTLPAAQAFWAAHHYYDSGGWLPPGYTSVYNGTGRPEPVLTAAEHDALVRWQDHNRHRGHDDDRRGRNENHWHVHAGDRDRAGEIMDELFHRIKVKERGGVYSLATVYTG